jgi:hypothetical protein
MHNRKLCVHRRWYNRLTTGTQQQGDVSNGLVHESDAISRSHSATALDATETASGNGERESDVCLGCEMDYIVSEVTKSRCDLSSFGAVGVRWRARTVVTASISLLCVDAIEHVRWIRAAGRVSTVVTLLSHLLSLGRTRIFHTCLAGHSCALRRRAWHTGEWLPCVYV